MALSDAILEIAEQLEGVGKEAQTPNNFVFFSFANQLRTAVKASEGNQLPAQQARQVPLDPAYQNFMMIEKAKAELREKRAKELLREDGMNSGMAVTIGGKSEATYVPIDPRMPVGAKTAIGLEVYVLEQDGKLHYSEVDTQDSLARFQPPQEPPNKIVLG